MSPLEQIRRVALVLSFAWLVIGVKAQNDEAQQQFAVRSFKSTVQQVEVAGWEQLRRVLVSCGTNECSLIVPHGFRVNVSGDKVTMIANDGSHFLSFRVLLPLYTDATGVDGCRQHVTELFPRAKILEEYSKSVSGHEGPAFSLRGKVGGQVARNLRVVLIPARIGTLEFTMSSDLPKSEEAEVAFNSILRSFRTNERSKLEVVIRTLDKS